MVVVMYSFSSLYIFEMGWACGAYGWGEGIV